MSSTKYGTGYAWKLENGDICNFVEAQKEFLHNDSKPSPGAVRLRVQIVPYGTIGRLKIKEAGRTVRAKRPVQQPQPKIAQAIMVAFKEMKFGDDKDGAALAARVVAQLSGVR